MSVSKPQRIVENRNNIKREVGNNQNILLQSELAVVINDAFPKARYHFLVSPKAEIPIVTGLTVEHVPLLEDMMDLANQIIERQENAEFSDFLIGFKMNPYMNGLCMHVVSTDFFSDDFKSVKVWNGFNTDLFISCQTALALLRTQGSIEPLTKDRIKELVAAKPLHCNQCDFNDESLGLLKVHLFQHWQKPNGVSDLNDILEKITQMLNKSKLEDSKRINGHKPKTQTNGSIKNHESIRNSAPGILGPSPSVNLMRPIRMPFVGNGRLLRPAGPAHFNPFRQAPNMALEFPRQPGQFIPIRNGLMQQVGASQFRAPNLNNGQQNPVQRGPASQLRPRTATGPRPASQQRGPRSAGQHWGPRTAEKQRGPRPAANPKSDGN